MGTSTDGPTFRSQLTREEVMPDHVTDAVAPDHSATVVSDAHSAPHYLA